jgi:hypothetical protein
MQHPSFGVLYAPPSIEHANDSEVGDCPVEAACQASVVLRTDRYEPVAGSKGSVAAWTEVAAHSTRIDPAGLFGLKRKEYVGLPVKTDRTQAAVAMPALK